MTDRNRMTTLTDDEISRIIAEVEAETIGGWVGATVRAAMGTVVLVLALCAMEYPDTARLFLLGLFLCACLAAYIAVAALSAARNCSQRASSAPRRMARGARSHLPPAEVARAW